MHCKRFAISKKQLCSWAKIISLGQVGQARILNKQLNVTRKPNKCYFYSKPILTCLIYLKTLGCINVYSINHHNTEKYMTLIIYKRFSIMINKQQMIC